MLDICFNSNCRFTRWAVAEGLAFEPLVVVDIGVAGGEHPRWRVLGDKVEIYGFDAIQEVIDDLSKRARGSRNQHYHCMAIGREDGEKDFVVNLTNPASSSFQELGESRFLVATKPVYDKRRVRVRKLDTLIREGVIPHPDFVKMDVEGFEGDVLTGARELLARGLLAVESEASFNVSPIYHESHFGAIQKAVLDSNLIAFDLSYDRIPRAAFQQALARLGKARIADEESVGKLGSLEVLFCRDPIAEADFPHHYAKVSAPLDAGRLLKLMIIYELHGLNDVAIDTAERFRAELSARLDVDRAIELLADPDCRISVNRVQAMRRSMSWRVTAPLRYLKSWLDRGRRWAR